MGTTESAERTESAKARPSTRNQEHADNKAPEKTETTNDEKLWQDCVKDLCESNQPKTFKQMKEMMQAYDFKVLSLSESFAASCFEEDCFLMGGPHRHREDFTRAQWSQKPDMLFVAIFENPCTEESTPRWFKACRNRFFL